MIYFKPYELRCQHCGQQGVKPDFLEIINQIREDWGQPLRVNSAYRCRNHPIEYRKPSVGTHTYGTAVDLDIPASLHYTFLQLVFTKHPVIQGIGIALTYIHLDIGGMGKKRPLLWTYGD